MITGVTTRALEMSGDDGCVSLVPETKAGEKEETNKQRGAAKPMNKQSPPSQRSDKPSMR